MKKSIGIYGAAITATLLTFVLSEILKRATSLKEIADSMVVTFLLFCFALLLSLGIAWCWNFFTGKEKSF